MYPRTVLRSSPTRRAIAVTVTPCRCSSRIMTISPSRTNDAPLVQKRGHHRSSVTDRLPDASETASAVSSPGEFSTGTSGDYSAGTHTQLAGAAILAHPLGRGPGLTIVVG